ncbi:MAG: DUF3616 domain-containing protein [Rhodospirillales bacterium]|nr:DUF3616 domain-containing protein [Rhodospirillales bacterium]MBT4006063.1 DUF3616 domain-containing protein [Rhodospirillales bacterium]MBT5075753.1 DUF3616 domain-containing protein [Rhodospirillales bacterium]MBT5112806.1 DUF3616 domain-containing protein [Rhodospirillales bacterium]MBT5673576.1 DUF3616 domain-containing protein [Rhodospirillales bacterium]
MVLAMFLVVVLLCPGALLASSVMKQGEYHEICDASAAIAMGMDHFVVANDEENTLRVYKRGVVKSVLAYNLDDFAKANHKRPEMDLEGAARIGNRAYWITSHGANKNGKDRPGRHRFFATNLGFKDGHPVITPQGQVYVDLLDDLAAEPRLKKYDLAYAAQIAPKDHGGLNIEGLAASKDGGLLIGFRNPLPGGKALVVALKNPDGIIFGKKPIIGAVRELSLGGLGIRSMDRVGDTLWIIAGPRDGGEKSRLFTLKDGFDPIDSGVDFGDLNPEALYVTKAGIGAGIQVLSDDGTRRIDGSKCKSIEDKRFRAIAVTPLAQN